MKSRTFAEARRHSSDVLRKGCERVRVSSLARPIADVEPARIGATAIRVGAAKRRLLEHLATVTPVGARDWTRDDLYR